MSERPCRAKNPETCREHGTKASFLKEVEAQAERTSNMETLVFSHGVQVMKGKFQAGDFAKSFNTVEGSNSHYDGPWSEVEALTRKYQTDFEPGTGSVDNDVILVNVPAANFYTTITPITDENRHLVEERDHVRQDGEKPVSMKFIKGHKQPAKFVQIVCYRADVLARDDGRTTNAEWEIVAINAQLDKYTPMHPTTMLRNNNHDEGGTYREYSQKEWDDAHQYWENHAYSEDT